MFLFNTWWIKCLQYKCAAIVLIFSGSERHHLSIRWVQQHLQGCRRYLNQFYAFPFLHNTFHHDQTWLINMYLEKAGDLEAEEQAKESIRFLSSPRNCLKHDIIVITVIIIVITIIIIVITFKIPQGRHDELHQPNNHRFNQHSQTEGRFVKLSSLMTRPSYYSRVFYYWWSTFWEIIVVAIRKTIKKYNDQPLPGDERRTWRMRGAETGRVRKAQGGFLLFRNTK